MIWTFGGTPHPELVVFIAVYADGPVGEGAPVKSVRPPSWHEDIRCIGDVLIREHAPQHLHDLRLGLVVWLLLDPPRLLVGDGDQEDIGVWILRLKLLNRATIPSRLEVVRNASDI